VKINEILETGGPEVLQQREAPTPTPGDGEVLIQVAADFGIKQKGVEA
jgi:NADPH:quinone reductase-like Zn-dependent oxidoreductase